MKKLLSVLLIFTLLFQCVGTVAEDNLSDKELLEYVESEIYADLVESLDPEQYFVEEVSATYVSREYLEELEYNSQANIFFGFNLDDINALYRGTRYIFTLGDHGVTTVEQFEEFQKDTLDKIIKNIIRGGSIIIVSVVIAVTTKNLAAGKYAPKAIRYIYTLSKEVAQKSSSAAISLAAIGGTTSAITEAYETGNFENVIEATVLGASDGFSMGAMFGAVEGIASGIFIKGDRYYFKPGTEQAKKYPDGIRVTKGKDGVEYLRLEEYAIDTAKFDMPTPEAAQNGFGLNGNYDHDAKLANAQCGYKNTPSGYVWHHVEDMMTMILVPQDLHSARFHGFFHKGGASLIRTYLDVA